MKNFIWSLQFKFFTSHWLNSAILLISHLKLKLMVSFLRLISFKNPESLTFTLALPGIYQSFDPPLSLLSPRISKYLTEKSESENRDRNAFCMRNSWKGQCHKACLVLNIIISAFARRSNVKLYAFFCATSFSKNQRKQKSSRKWRKNEEKW